MANPFCHIELATDHPERARAFYGALFSWTFEVMPMGHGPYIMLQTGEGPGGGIMGKPMPEAPTAWMPYVQVDDLDATMLKVGELGGQIVV
jgi:predicted enzyme related to lactoylglutathione lyase